MVLAVLDRRLGAGLARRDTYVATVGGVRLGEPSADLAVAMALASAHSDAPLRPGLVVIGEVGLAGEVRPVAGVGRRLLEAARLGFTHAIVPAGSDDATPSGLAVLEVPDLATALGRSLTTRRAGPA
jgi:DNA repair protein RadA/Sms